jgi:hypothetical protein
LFFTNYTGSVTIQGSLSEGGNPEVWVDVETLALTTATLTYQNITGKYNWFRVKHTPNKLITNNGTVDKILYR